MKVVIVNDTSLWENHFGCQLVGQSFRENCLKHDLEILTTVGLRFGEECYSKFEKADLILINGEGSIHHNRNTHLLKIAERWPTALVNCVWQDNRRHPALSKLKFISFRESKSLRSWNELKVDGVPSVVVPDLVFGAMLTQQMASERPTAVAGILTTDDVNFARKSRRKFKGIQNRRRYASGEILRCDIPPAFMFQKILNSQEVLTGRFHAVALSIACQKTFACWKSNTHKIEGMLADAGLEDRLISSKFDVKAANALPQLELEKAAAYFKSAKMKINQLFQNLHKLG